MKHLFFVFSLLTPICYGQLSLVDARTVADKYEVGSYSYHEQFKGFKGYAAPIVSTTDGGAIIFGDHSDKSVNTGIVIKLDKNGREEWKKYITPEFVEIESQSVIQDQVGNYYIFMLSYKTKGGNGTQRVIYLDKTGTILWDQTIGDYALINRPIFSYIHLLEDGRLSFRGHIVVKEPVNGADPDYYYWEGWMDNKGDNKGALTQKTGAMIDWADAEWQKFYQPE